MISWMINGRIVSRTLLAVCFSYFVCCVPTATAALAPIQVKPGKISSPVRSGVLEGGIASDEFSIYSIERASTPEGSERLVITYGDRFGNALKGDPGFFHVAFDQNSRRISVDLAQVSRTAVDQNDLAKVLTKSIFVASSDMTMDPVDGSTNITLHLKNPVSISVSSESGNISRVVIEMRGLSALPVHSSIKESGGQK